MEKVYTQPAPWSRDNWNAPRHAQHCMTSKSAAGREPATALAVVLEPVALVKGVSEFFAEGSYAVTQ